MHAVPVQQVSPSSASSASATQAARQDDDSFGFWDFLDIINPLQHIPIVNVLYREITGDEIGSAAKLIGGGLYGLGLLGGGWVSLASSAVDFAVEGATGEDLAGHAMNFLFGEDGEGTATAGAGGEETGGGGADGDAVAAAVAAIPRPEAVVVRSTALADAPATPMFGQPAVGTAPAAAVEADGLAAMTGQVVSPEMGQALLFAAQSDDPAAASQLQALMAESAAGPDRRRMIAPGVVGFSLDRSQVQAASGITHDRLANGLHAGAN